MRTPPKAVFALVLLLVACSGDGGSNPDAAPEGGTDTEPEFEPDLPFADCEIEWEHIYEIPDTNSTRAPSLVALDNGHFVLVGQATFDSAPDQGLIMETDENGEVLWFELLRGEGFEEFFEHIHEVDSGYILLGLTNEMGELSCWAVRTTEEAEVVWSVVIPDSNCLDTSQKPDGSILFSNIPPILGEIQPSGNFETYNLDSFGSEYFTTGVIGFPNGQSALTGFFHELDTDLKHALMLIVDTDYSLLKIKIDESPYETTLGPALENTSDDHFIVGGWAEFGDGVFYQKSSFDGAVIWRRFIGNQGGDSFNSLLRSDEDFIFVGRTKERDGYVGRFDHNGHLLWHFKYGYTEEDGFNDVVRSQDGGYVIAGTTLHKPSGVGLRFAWLLKIGNNGYCD